MSREDGFSLIEVLCAVTVAALALVLFLQMRSAATRLDSRVFGETVARTVAAEKFALGVMGEGSVGNIIWQAKQETYLRDSKTGLRLVRETVLVEAGDGVSFRFSRYVLDQSP